MADENEKQIEIIKSIRENKPELMSNCYAVGLWVWAEFSQKPNQDALAFLKGLGFRWNPKRKVWQNACGFKTRMSAGDPRQKYQIVRFGEE
jgi:hypothetical protein